jgi:hypothetical protein
VGQSVATFCDRNWMGPEACRNNRDLTFASFHGARIESPLISNWWISPLIHIWFVTVFRGQVWHLFARMELSSKLYISLFNVGWTHTILVDVALLLSNPSVEIECKRIRFDRNTPSRIIAPRFLNAQKSFAVAGTSRAWFQISSARTHYIGSLVQFLK